MDNQEESKEQRIDDESLKNAGNKPKSNEAETDPMRTLKDINTLLLASKTN